MVIKAAPPSAIPAINVEQEEEEAEVVDLGVVDALPPDAGKKKKRRRRRGKGSRRGKGKAQKGKKEEGAAPKLNLGDGTGITF